MARKANIAKEEIIQACWDLIEQNIFPNIPRLSDYFKNLDGRGCSNTTLLNAISEWEESYKEHQENELKEVTEHFAPTFKRFERDIIQSLSIILDEQITAHEEKLSLRQSSIEGRERSLSESFINSQQELETTLEQKQIFETRCNELQQSQKALEDRLEHSLTRNRVLESEIEQWKLAQREADTKLHQAQVDLAKQDNEISQLKQLLTDSQAEVQRLKKQNDQLLNSAIEQVSKLAESVATKASDS